MFVTHGRHTLQLPAQFLACTASVSPTLPSPQGPGHLCSISGSAVRAAVGQALERQGPLSTHQHLQAAAAAARQSRGCLSGPGPRQTGAAAGWPQPTAGSPRAPGKAAPWALHPSTLYCCLGVCATSERIQAVLEIHAYLCLVFGTSKQGWPFLQQRSACCSVTTVAQHREQNAVPAGNLVPSDADTCFNSCHRWTRLT